MTKKVVKTQINLPYIPTLDLASYVIAYCNNAGQVITLTTLQKVLYYIQVYHLVEFKKHPLFEEKAEAWASGPVYASVQDWYSGVEHKALSVNVPIQTLPSFYSNILTKFKISKDQITYIDNAIAHFASKTPFQLTLRALIETPWNYARERCKGDSIFKITFNSMYRYYSKRK